MTTSRARQAGGSTPTRNRAASLLLLVLVLVLGLVVAPVARGGSSAKPKKKASVTVMVKYQKRLAAAINKTRKRYGLHPLKVKPSLTRAARAHSKRMARKGCLQHTSPCGINFAVRIKSYFARGSYSYFAAGENLFWARVGATPGQAVSAWLASPTHRSVLLSPQWRAVGVGVVHAIHAPGIFGGRNVVIVTADFAVRR